MCYLEISQSLNAMIFNFSKKLFETEEKFLWFMRKTNDLCTEYALILLISLYCVNLHDIMNTKDNI